ncbi:MAG: endolytic transglycosylase MltG [Gaiellales bacterium]
MSARPNRTFGLIAAAVAVLAVLAIAWWGISRLVASPPPPPGPPVTVVIPAGSSASQIGRILEQADVVGSAGDFVDHVVADGLGTGFKPGTYTFRTNELYARIVEQLNAGPSDAQATRLTIPEGYAIWDIKAAVARVGITPAAYQRALDAHPPPSGFLAPGERAASLEGFLFPATYDVAVPADADTLVTDQLAAFDANWASVDMGYAAARNLTRYDVLKIASIVEREAKAPADRAKVAAVIYNRLRRGMSLGMDSTVQYAVGSWGELTAADLKVDSPYNLRVRKGLPPTPICNPGLAAIKAAAAPAKADYLYMYAIKGDAQGRHYFTASYQDFLAYMKKHPYS